MKTIKFKEPIFFGCGDVTGNACYDLHKKLGEIMAGISGLQQGRCWDEDNVMGESVVKDEINNLLLALGYQATLVNVGPRPNKEEIHA